MTPDDRARAIAALACVRAAQMEATGLTMTDEARRAFRALDDAAETLGQMLDPRRQKTGEAA